MTPFKALQMGMLGVTRWAMRGLGSNSITQAGSSHLLHQLSWLVLREINGSPSLPARLVRRRHKAPSQRFVVDACSRA